MTHISVHEWSRAPVHNGSGAPPAGHFSRSQANALIAAARSHPLGGDEGAGIISDHYRHLAAKQMVGMIAAPGCSLEILPKVDPLSADDDATIRSRLVRMLDVALGLDLGEGAAAAMARQSETLLDILIRLFADRLLSESRRGLPRAYLAREDDLPALRGRLDIGRQFTAHAVRPDRLACRFDVLSPDIPLLQIMKACVIVLRRHARALHTIRRLDELRFLLSEVGDIPIGRLPWDRVRIDRSSHRWEVLFRLARLFLKREWQTTHHATDAGQGITLLFPMNDLFEAYVAALAKRALRDEDVSVDAQGGRLFCLIEEGEGGRSRFQTRPDLLLKRGKEVVGIIDTKWKRLSRIVEDAKHGVSQGDVYQMMAYGQIYCCARLMLLYPHHWALGSGALSARYIVNSSQHRLSLGTADLAKPEAVLTEQLRIHIASLIGSLEKTG